MAENNSYLELLNNSNLANISNEEKEIMQIKLWTLLGKVTERYTMGDSSSVPVEIAEELLKSITFLLNKEMKNSQSIVKLFESESLESAWKDSWATIEKDIAKGKELLEEVMKTSTGIENISYEDTVVEIEKGIKVYDYRFFAHEISCSIDYQLSNAVSEDLQGIDLINEYLTRLLFENKFCNNFEKEKIIGILKSYCKKTGIKSRGLIKRDDLTGTNWSKVPVTLIEMGFLSNASEDRFMNKTANQEKMAAGIADGIDDYFGF